MKPNKSVILLFAIYLAGLSVMLYSFYRVMLQPFRIEWVLLVLLVALGAIVQTNIPKAPLTFSTSGTFVFVSILIYGVYPSCLLGAVDALCSSLFIIRKKWLIPANIAVQTISVALSALALKYTVGWYIQSWSTAKLFLSTISVTLLYSAFNAVLISIVRKLISSRGSNQVFQEVFLWALSMELFGALAACLIVQMLAEKGIYAFLIATPTLAIVYLSHWFNLRQVTSQIYEAETDALTGIPNKRALERRFSELVTGFESKDYYISILMIDIDGFKTVNDKLGHETGDRVLQEISHVMSGLLRLSDFLCRYGGDEFVIIVQITSNELPVLTQRLQAIVDQYDFKLTNPDISIGISVGGACLGKDGTTLRDLIRVADKKMYSDKGNRKALARTVTDT